MKVVRCVLFTLSVVWLAGCAHTVQNVEWIPHISALRLADSNEVMFESNEPNWKIIAKAPGFPSAIKTNGVTQLTLQAGNSFILTEGHHGWMVYKLLRVTDGQIILEETTTDRPPDKPKAITTVRRIRVSPYSRESAASGKTLSQEEIGFWVNHLDDLKRADINMLHRALVCDQTYLRAKAAQQLGETGEATSISLLINALSDESFHVGVDYPAAGLETTRYWANESLKKLTKLDFGFRWDASKAERQAAIKRWKQWFSKHEPIPQNALHCPNGHLVKEVPILMGGPPTEEMADKEKRGEAILGGCMGKDSIAQVCLYCRIYKTKEMLNWQPVSLAFGLLGSVAPPVKPLSQKEIAFWCSHINGLKDADVDTLHRALVCGQTCLRVDAAQRLGEVGDATSISHLVDALRDESACVGDRTFKAGMETTRYWANESLKKLTKQDFGFRWDASKEHREAAIQRWRQWFSEQEFADLLRLVAKSKQP
jgi:hypothetical protein